VESTSDSLLSDLGPGRHFGEWHGSGIQRNYGLDHKRFALFNTHRFAEAAEFFLTPRLGVVPLLFVGGLSEQVIRDVHNSLMGFGSEAAPGFMQPEGVVVYLHETRVSWKITDAKAGPGKHA
jgi:hypothetical protein